MKCPECGLINPDTALRCDCGYDFATGDLKDSYLPPERLRALDPEPAGLNLIQRLWRGYVPLVWTYWLFGVVGGMVIFGFSAYSDLFWDSLDDSPAMILLSMFTLLGLAYQVLIMVAIWRSADRYQGSSVWRQLAKVAVIMGGIRALLQLVRGVTGSP